MKTLAAAAAVVLLVIATAVYPAEAQETTTTAATETTESADVQEGEVDTPAGQVDVDNPVDDDDSDNTGLWGLAGLLGLLGLAGLAGRKRNDDRVSGTTYQAAPTGATRANPPTGGAHRENT
jgi:hypothetical protein